MPRNKRNVTAVDISNSKIRTCLAEEERGGKVNVLAACETDVKGVDRSIITNLGEVAETLKRMLDKIREETGICNHSVYLNISGSHLDTGNSHGAVMIQNSRNQITKRDLDNVIASAYAQGVSLNRQVIHSLVYRYTIDEQDNIFDPIDMYARKLEVDLFIISGIDNIIKNLKKAVNQAGYEIKALAASAFADSYSVLTEEEKKSGVILLDLGAGVTDIAFFRNKNLRGFKVIDAGGEDITVELSKKLKISLSYAEEIKKRYGSAASQLKDKEEDIVLKSGDNDFKKINKYQISDCVQKILHEILKEVKSALEDTRCLQEAPCGVVVTGGVTLLDGLIEKTQEYLNMPARLGLPANFTSNNKIINNPAWSTCLGLARFALRREDAAAGKDANSNIFSGLRKKIEAILTDYF
jgi:cell division protein FtsA